MYVCGPTVYADAHIGHAMSAVVFDVIRRYLEFRGYSVRHVMNYTDVDDRIIERAQQVGLPPEILAEHHIQAFRQHMFDLNVLPPIATPRATKTMDRIQTMILGLIQRGYAYVSAGDVYFRVTRSATYGKLSGRRLEDMQTGSRIAGHPKENPVDFALWKGAKPGEPSWDSPWGSGRPGWHIECSAMNLDLLGDQIDIHGGGNDLVFPHHENEIAQTEAYTGKPFARYWVHNGMLQLAGEKMSKSVGNLVTIEGFLASYGADTLRLMVLGGSYRAPLTYTEETATAAGRAVARLRTALAPATGTSGADRGVLESLESQRRATEESFVVSMDDDFGTAGALATIFDLVRTINTARDAGATAPELLAAQMTVQALTGVLGFRLTSPTKQGVESGKLVDLLVEVRDRARAKKDWETSDYLRDRLQELGVTVQDRTTGTTAWRWR
jgi:cysteinyl-tRNA synthetase